MSPIEAAKAHFQLFATRVIEVPEWVGADGAPLLVYARPLTLMEQQKIAGYGNRLGQGEAAAMTIILLARKSDGSPMFTIADKHALMHSVDPNVVGRLIVELCRPMSVEDQQKN